MRGTTNAVQSNLPRNVSHSYISTVIFGANTYNGWYYSSMLGMPNADKVTITLEGMGVVGESWWTGSTLASKVAMDQSPIGLIFRCNDASVIGKACNPVISIVGGGTKKARSLLQALKGVLKHARKHQRTEHQRGYADNVDQHTLGINGINRVDVQGHSRKGAERGPCIHNKILSRKQQQGHTSWYSGCSWNPPLGGNKQYIELTKGLVA